jgi:hypothetical protein
MRLSSAYFFARHISAWLVRRPSSDDRMNGLFQATSCRSLLHARYSVISIWWYCTISAPISASIALIISLYTSVYATARASAFRYRCLLSPPLSPANARYQRYLPRHASIDLLIFDALSFYFESSMRLSRLLSFWYYICYAQSSTASLRLTLLFEWLAH